jgi:hypothetical protein
LRADGRLPFILVLVAQPVTSNKRVVDMKAMAAFFWPIVRCFYIGLLPAYFCITLIALSAKLLSSTRLGAYKISAVGKIAYHSRAINFLRFLPFFVNFYFITFS